MGIAMSLGIVLLLGSFNRLVLYFPLGFWSVYSHVLGLINSVRSGFHLMERALNPTRKWLVAPVTLAAVVPPGILQAAC